MDTLHSSVDKLLSDLPLQLVAQLIVEKLDAQGVTLSDRERSQLEQHLREERSGVLRLRSWKWWERKEVTLQLTAQDSKELESRFTTFLERRLPSILTAIIGELATTMQSGLNEKWPAESRRQKRDTAGFRQRLRKHWGAPLDLLSQLLTVAKEFGTSLNEEVRSAPNGQP